MIRGSVNPRNEIVFRITILDSQGNPHELETILDTGFNGALTLPSATIFQLGLPWASRASGVLADGSIGEFDVYRATVIWDGAPRSITVDVMNTAPLLGMRLLVGYDLYARVLDGGHATLTAVP
jgi:clan AA aspartic protease